MWSEGKLGDVFDWCEALRGLQALAGVDEGGEVGPKSVVAFAIVSPRRSLPSEFGSSVCPGMARLGQAVINVVQGADRFE